MGIIIAFLLYFNSFSVNINSDFIAQHFKEAESRVGNCSKQTEEKRYLVNVAVSTQWKEPNVNRELDLPSLLNPTDLKGWTNSMTVEDRKWLVGKIETQALYGHEVVILQEQGDWVEVAVKGQYTAKNEQGYPGWMPKAQLIETNYDYSDCMIAIVKENTSFLYDEDKTTKFMEISFNTWLPVINEEGDWVAVHTPSHEPKYIKKADVNVHKDAAAIPNPTQDDLVNTAKKFLDLHYLWAGMSGFGFDCSGFVGSVHRFHGINIPRDASEQAKDGLNVPLDALEPGDLVFFAYEKGKGRIHHVGMYIGDGNMIHAPNSARSVEIISLDVPAYKEELCVARRYWK